MSKHRNAGSGDQEIESTALDPAAPQSIEELGVPPFVIHDLALRFLREHGTVSLTALRKALKLSYPIVETIFQQLRQQQFVDIKGTVGTDYLFTLTSSARQLAAERSETCRYAGPAPVSLKQYAEVVRYQRTEIRPTEAQLREALADLVLSGKIIDRLGAAMTSRRPLFVYGPSGNGKTSIIERLPCLYDDFILVPYAVEVDTHIISVFDPLIHRAAPESDENLDQRWVRCLRPCVTAAGELVASMLNVRLDEPSGVYTAPLQMKANNGILLIDDFGRQAMPPRELLNRWILPLDRRVDYLSLQYGYTFQIPFELTLVFATNLEPTDLADEAFLRRVPNKIHVEPVTPSDFDEIFKRVLEHHGVPFEPGLSVYLRALCEHATNHLCGCYPNDICEILLAQASYRRQPIHLTRRTLGVAAEMYFTNTVSEKP